LGSKAKKERIRELNIKYKVNFLTLQETTMDSISAMDVKLLWGNYNFDHVFSEAVGSVFNVQGANEFNNFISNSGLVEVQLEGYSFTWSHTSATKMSKLDRFLVTEGLVSLFPRISGICIDKHLSDHRPILLREVITDYGATPFRMYHSWFSLHGFEQMVTHTWNSIVLDDRNGMVRFKKKMQFLEKGDSGVDQGGVNDEILLSRMDLLKQMQDIKSFDVGDCMQKAKIQWAIEGDENSKFFHGIINRKRVNLAIKGVMVDGEWMDDHSRVKEEFRLHFATRFQAPGVNRSRLNFRFPNRLNPNHVAELENPITRDEIRNAAWVCGENKSPGQTDLLLIFSGCNSSFVALIPKTHDPKFVSDYRPISLIGSLYKVVTKILATRLSMDISDLILDVQTAFLPNRQILDGPFIINKLLSWWIFTGIKIDSSLTISYLFYADDAVFIGEWSNANLTGNSSTIKAWDDTIGKLKARLANWKLKTLSIGGRLTLLKSVLGSTPIYNMSLYKVPKSVLYLMESIRRNFFNRIQGDERKITWVNGLRFISQDNSLWCRFITSMHGSQLLKLSLSPFHSSTWNTIIREINVLKSQGVDLISHCKIHVGNDMRTQFWNDILGSVALSLRRTVRGWVEAHQLDFLQNLIRPTIFDKSGGQMGLGPKWGMSLSCQRSSQSS
nr:RNA-directed DNA polymerase, eukaryota [Tanacetum cinerariifolium]